MPRHAARSSGNRASARQQRAIRLLLDPPDGTSRPRAAVLAAAASYSTSRLRAIARAALGESPAARLRRRRLDAAASALLTGQRSMARLAKQAGFRSTEAFHRAFRARFGCTPRAWARRQPSPRVAKAFALGAALARHLVDPLEPRNG
jgi:AraC-like DNA-binding protein